MNIAARLSDYGADGGNYLSEVSWSQLDGRARGCRRPDRAERRHATVGLAGQGEVLEVAPGPRTTGPAWMEAQPWRIPVARHPEHRRCRRRSAAPGRRRDQIGVAIPLTDPQGLDRRAGAGRRGPGRAGRIERGGVLGGPLAVVLADDHDPDQAGQRRSSSLPRACRAVVGHQCSGRRHSGVSNLVTPASSRSARRDQPWLTGRGLVYFFDRGRD